jgi:hypothetical protein
LRLDRRRQRLINFIQTVKKAANAIVIQSSRNAKGKSKLAAVKKIDRKECASYALVHKIIPDDNVAAATGAD